LDLIKGVRGMWVLILLGLLLIVSIKYLGNWIGLLVTIKWMQINKMPQPSDQQRREITKWVASNILKDLKKI
jgi:hypothetical protein